MRPGVLPSKPPTVSHIPEAESYERGLEALQIGAITMGLPSAVVLTALCYSLLKGLQREWHDEHGAVDQRT